MTIAIAEDNTTTRRELSRLLTSHGYETVLPDDFKDLAGQLAGLSADLILLDVNLPYENGYDICRRIRELTRTPVIFVTSRDTSADELMSIRAGGIDFVSKPYDPLILLEKIRRALRLTDPGNFRELTRKGCTLDLPPVSHPVQWQGGRTHPERIPHPVLFLYEQRKSYRKRRTSGKAVE